MAESFEDIVRGQFSPSLDRWYELGLDEQLPLLEPDSDVGEMAIRLYDECRAAGEGLRQARRQDIDDLETARRANQEASERWSMFHQLYYRIWTRLGEFEGDERLKQYSKVVSEACDEEISHLSSPGYNPLDLFGTCQLVREVGNLYQVEPRAHFADLDAFEQKALGDG